VFLRSVPQAEEMLSVLQVEQVDLPKMGLELNLAKTRV